MSSYALAVAKKKIGRFVLWPIALIFGVATWVSVDYGRWLAAAAFLLLILYVGWLASMVSLRTALPPYEAGNVDREELHHLASFMKHVYYALVIATIVAARSAGVRFYWAILIASGTWILAQIVGGFVMALISSPRLSPGLRK